MTMEWWVALFLSSCSSKHEFTFNKLVLSCTSYLVMNTTYLVMNTTYLVLNTTFVSRVEHEFCR